MGLCRVYQCEQHVSAVIIDYCARRHHDSADNGNNHSGAIDTSLINTGDTHNDDYRHYPQHADNRAWANTSRFGQQPFRR